MVKHLMITKANHVNNSQPKSAPSSQSPLPPLSFQFSQTILPVRLPANLCGHQHLSGVLAPARRTRGTGIATPSSRRRVVRVEDDTTIQRERARKLLISTHAANMNTTVFPDVLEELPDGVHRVRLVDVDPAVPCHTQSGHHGG